MLLAEATEIKMIREYFLAERAADLHLERQLGITSVRKCKTKENGILVRGITTGQGMEISYQDLFKKSQTVYCRI